MYGVEKIGILMAEGKVNYHRKYPRIDLEIQATFKIIGKELDQQSVFTHTLGGGGLMLYSDIPLAVGDQIEMALFYLGLQIDFLAKVVWTEQLMGDEFRDFKCGFEFTEISDENRSLIMNIILSNRQSEA